MENYLLQFKLKQFLLQMNCLNMIRKLKQLNLGLVLKFLNKLLWKLYRARQWQYYGSLFNYALYEHVGSLCPDRVNYKSPCSYGGLMLYSKVKGD